MSHCPSCGRYVGPRDACPYCAARTSGRLPIRALKLAAIVLATAGMAVLWFVATRTEVPSVAIGRVGATMNLAYVRIAGRCISVPSYDPQIGYLGFWVADETGELYVTSYRAETQKLIEEERVPALGDQVAVAGTLRIREDFRSLTVNVPESVAITRARPESCPIGAITPGQAYRRVRVRGQVRQVIEPYPALTLITLRDETGTIDLALSDDLMALSSVTPTVEVGQSVEVEAAVSRYRETAQLVPASAADIVVLDASVPVAEHRFVMGLCSADVGEWVSLRGIVTDVDPFLKGLRVTLDDGSGKITVLLWEGVYEDLADDLVMGVEISVQGELAEYRGELEVVPQLPGDVRVIASAHLARATYEPPETERPAAPSPSPSPASIERSTPELPLGHLASLTPVQDITPARVGEWITLEGNVVGASSFSHGFKLTLDDGGAQIALLLWHDVYDSCRDRSRLAVGATVLTTGEINQYEGTLQIEPRSGDDVMVTKPARVIAERLDIGSISRISEGQRVMIEGEVARLEQSSSAVTIFLVGDGEPPRDQIRVFIWRSLLDRVADSGRVTASGARLRVLGTVQTYGGSLELLPALPSDVMVLPSPQEEGGQ